MKDKGAHFYNCDFQVHSPRDENWTGKRPTSDEDRKTYAEGFIKACRDKGLDAVAITDHHDMVFVKYIRDAAKNETDEDGNPISDDRKIVVFPGMELTLQVTCQALLIFDANFPSHLFSDVTRLLAINTSDEDDEKTAATVPIANSEKIDNICELFDRHDDIKGRYIIFPNITNGGEHSILRNKAQSKYICAPCVGGYIDGSIERLKPGYLKIVSGECKEWGHKKVAIFQTSDNRKESFEDLGKHSSWVKWAEPTAEALRQACLADKTRISHSEPSLPLTYIKKVRVSNSKFMGPIDIDLNPQYSAFIGGRGTGKSTVLEYLRWGLCDHSLQNVNDDSPEYKKRSKKLIENTLMPIGSILEITISVNGIEYVIKRSAENFDIHLKAKGEDYREVKSDEIRSLIPIQAYSQKQMSDVGVRIGELKRFIYSPIIEELHKIDDRFETLSNKIRKQYAEVRQKRTVEREISKQSSLMESLTAQTNEIKKSLKGLSDKDQKIIEQNAVYQEVNSTVETWEEEISLTADLFRDFAEGIENFPAELPENFEKLPKEDQEQVQKLKNNISGKYKVIQENIELIAKEVNALANPGVDVTNDFELWIDKLENFEEIYNQAKERSSAHQSKLLRLKELEERIKAIRSHLSKLKTELGALGDPLKDYDQLIEEWIELHVKRTQLIQSVCKNLSEYSKSEIEADLLVGHGFSDIETGLEEAIKGSGIRGPKEKIANIKSYIIKENVPLRAWFNIIKELEGIALFDHENEDKKDLPDAKILSKQGFSTTDLYNLSAKFDLDTWLDLSLLRLKDNPRFEYHKGEGEYIDFQDASAGQQATSLLKALLNQAGPPLVIDQPEDDLDNKIISEVVQQIWEAKSKRQIIFASHNANLVVNGDADLVVCCDYATDESQARGKIESVGAIDITETKNSIKRVMEGGEKAFELRRQKYGF
jgi:chromosome segregation protein